MKSKRFRIKAVMLAAVVCLMLTGCDTPIKVEYPEFSGLNCYIVVDEDSLVQYIKCDYNAGNCSTSSITVRLKADGTPYTIAPEDLNKYPHFSFSENAGS